MFYNELTRHIPCWNCKMNDKCEVQKKFVRSIPLDVREVAHDFSFVCDIMIGRYDNS